MRWKKTFVVCVALALLLAMAGLSSAQYEHEITDAQDDVDHLDDVGWTYNVERPNVDIVRAEISEGGEGVIVSLTVKGTITDATNIEYVIILEDGEDGTYTIHYSDGSCNMYVESSEGMLTLQPDTNGAGTSTLSMDISLDDIHNPASLEITEVITYEYMDEETEYYWDTAEPEDDQNGATDPDDEDTTFDDEDYPEFIDDLIARGMMCLLIAIIIPIIIVIIVIIVIVKIVKKDDKGDGGQPPRQEYQQPPPPSQAPRSPERQYQEPVPPEETGGEVSPGEEMIEEEDNI